MMDESRNTHSPISPTWTGKNTIPAPIAIPMLIIIHPISVLSNRVSFFHSSGDNEALSMFCSNMVIGIFLCEDILWWLFTEVRTS